MRRILEPFLVDRGIDRVGMPLTVFLVGTAELLVALFLWYWPMAIAGSLFAGGGGLMLRHTYRSQRRRRQFSPVRVAALGDPEMETLGVILNSEQAVGVYELQPLRADSDRDALHVDRQRCWMMLDALWRAGLIERLPQDSDQFENARVYVPSPAAAEIYAGYLAELERRDEASVRVGPLGPRSRSSALAG